MSAPKSYRPAPGCRVRKLDGTLVLEAGEALPRHPYYARLIADRDLIPATKAKTTRSNPA